MRYHVVNVFVNKYVKNVPNNDWLGKVIGR